jgi:hypothetical protein
MIIAIVYALRSILPDYLVRHARTSKSVSSDIRLKRSKNDRVRRSRTDHARVDAMSGEDIERAIATTSTGWIRRI